VFISAALRQGLYIKVAAVASRWQRVGNLIGSGFEPHTSRTPYSHHLLLKQDCRFQWPSENLLFVQEKFPVLRCCIFYILQVWLSNSNFMDVWKRDLHVKVIMPIPAVLTRCEFS